MSKKGWLIPAAISLALGGALLTFVYHVEKGRNKAYNDFVRRWNAEYQRGRAANEKLIALNEELNRLMEKSVRPPQEFGRAEMLMTASNENLSNALEIFKKIPDRLKKSWNNLDDVNVLLSLTEKPIKQAEELNKLLEQELQDLKNAESPK